MILNNRSQSTIVASEGVGAVTAVNIANTPHMFSLLSSGLYSDKIAAVLREVACNAMDAHIMSGQPERPIEVKLPSSLDRTFYIKDWGPGLSDQEFRECYTTYGWSNKQQNEDATGAFGLGSKSPFAYTLQNRDEADGYTVEAVKDGVRRVYTVFLGPSGGPQVAQLGEFPADDDWKSGVKVSFPVQTRDINEFHEKAKRVYRWFKVKPDVLGLTGQITAVQFRTREDFFGIGENEPAGVVSGNVWYPLRVERLRDLNEVEMLFARNITLFLPIGTVMMTPAREELEYNEMTRQNVKEYLTKAALKVAQEIRDVVMQPAPTKWEWYKNILSYHDSLPFYLRNNLPAVLKYAGVSAEDAQMIAEATSSKVAPLPNWFGTVNAVQKIDSPVPLNCTAARYSHTGDRVSRRPIQFGHTNEKLKSKDGRFDYVKATISYLRPPLMVYEDAPLTSARVKGYVAEHGDVILVSPVDKKDAQAAKEYLEALVTSPEFAGLGMVASSTLPLPADYEEKKRIARENKKKAPRALISKEEIQYLDLKTKKVVPGVFSDLGDEDIYYLETQGNRSDWKRNLFNQSPGGWSIVLSSDYRHTTFSALCNVLKHVMPGVSKVLILMRPNDRKRYKLSELEFKPLAHHLREVVKKDTKLQSLLTLRSQETQKQMKSGSALLRMFMQAADATDVRHSLWQAMSRYKSLASLMMDVLKEKSLHRESTPDEALLLDSFATFKSALMSSNDERETMLLNGYQINQQFMNKYGFLDTMDLNTLWDYAVSQPEETAALLVQLQSMCATQVSYKAAEEARIAAERTARAAAGSETEESTDEAEPKEKAFISVYE